MNGARRGKVERVSHSRWVAYATAGAATMVAGVNSAEAAIHYSGPINETFNAPASSSTSAVFPLAGAAFLELEQARGSASHANGGEASFFMRAGVSAQFVGTAQGSTLRYVSKLNFGANISARPFLAFNSRFAVMARPYGLSPHTQWGTAGTGFIGFKFNIGSGVEYGWARVTMNGGTENSFTLVDYAWGDPGDVFTAGQTTLVPEPGSLGLLAVGAAGLLAWRRRRAQSSTA